MAAPVPTVIRVDRGENGNLICKLVSAPNAPADLKYYAFDVRMTDDADAPIKAEGKAIWDALSRSSQGIASALTTAMRVSAPDVSPIFIEPFAIPAEQVRWEVLYEAQNKFIALDRCWPVTRKAQRERPVETLEVQFAPPLKVVAVCAATGVPAEPEWDALHEAALAAMEAGLPVDLMLLTGDVDLQRRVKGEQAKGLLPWVTLRGVPDTAADFENLVSAQAPHIVHFFCHGLIDAGGAWLDIQTLIPNVGLKLDVETLVGMRAMRETWFVVLNSCLSGTPNPNAPSMAYRLVARGGIPAVIGNMEPVDVDDAHALTAGFYASLVRQFGVEFGRAHPGDSIPIDLAQALCDARSKIGTRLPEPHDRRLEWAKPVLYVRDAPFTIRKRGMVGGPAPAQPQPAVVLKPAVLTMIAELLAVLPPSTPPEVRQKFVETIIATANAA